MPEELPPRAEAVVSAVARVKAVVSRGGTGGGGECCREPCGELGGLSEGGRAGTGGGCR